MVVHSTVTRTTREDILRSQKYSNEGLFDSFFYTRGDRLSVVRSLDQAPVENTTVIKPHGPDRQSNSIL